MHVIQSSQLMISCLSACRLWDAFLVSCIHIFHYVTNIRGEGEGAHLVTQLDNFIQVSIMSGFISANCTSWGGAIMKTHVAVYEEGLFDLREANLC